MPLNTLRVHEKDKTVKTDSNRKRIHDQEDFATCPDPLSPLSTTLAPLQQHPKAERYYSLQLRKTMSVIYLVRFSTSVFPKAWGTYIKE